MMTETEDCLNWSQAWVRKFGVVLLVWGRKDKAREQKLRNLFKPLHLQILVKPFKVPSPSKVLIAASYSWLRCLSAQVFWADQNAGCRHCKQQQLKIAQKVQFCDGSEICEPILWVEQYASSGGGGGWGGLGSGEYLLRKIEQHQNVWKLKSKLKLSKTFLKVYFSVPRKFSST